MINNENKFIKGDMYHFKAQISTDALLLIFTPKENSANLVYNGRITKDMLVESIFENFQQLVDYLLQPTEIGVRFEIDELRCILRVVALTNVNGRIKTMEIFQTSIIVNKIEPVQQNMISKLHEIVLLGESQKDLSLKDIKSMINTLAKELIAQSKKQSSQQETMNIVMKKLSEVNFQSYKLKLNQLQEKIQNLNIGVNQANNNKKVQKMFKDELNSLKEEFKIKFQTIQELLIFVEKNEQIQKKEVKIEHNNQRNKIKMEEGKPRRDNRNYPQQPRRSRREQSRIQRIKTQFIKIIQIEPGAQNFIFIAKIISAVRAGRNFRCVLGDETGLVNALLRENGLIRVGFTIQLGRTLAEVRNEHIQIKCRDIFESDQAINEVNTKVNISQKEWICKE